MTDEEDKGFKVTDKRKTRAGGEKAAESQAGPGPAPGVEAEESMPPVDFISFVLSLATSTLIHLGEVPDPVSGEKAADMTAAKQTIEVLSLLQEKTKGNLSDEEARVIDNLLADLRMRYLKAIEFIKES